MANTRSFKLAFAALCGVTLAACDSSGGPSGPSNEVAVSGPKIQSIQVEGADTFADGSPLGTEKIQYQLILDGADMFHAGANGCLPTPAHVAGTTIKNSSTDAQGKYSVGFPVSGLHAAVVLSCSIQELYASQVEGATIRASVLADATTCPSFCSAQGTPGSDCVTDCESGERTIIASQALDQDEMSALISQYPDGNLVWSAPLSFSGLGPALTPGAGPDLQVDGGAAQASAHVDVESFDSSSCEVAEQCVRAAGSRTVLRFDGTIQNIGSADLMIGDPSNSPLFTSSSCHNVSLLKNIMLYELLDPETGESIDVDGQQIVGRKQGFCMMDITQINASAPQGQYSCTNQGITRGWADVYDAALDCQFLDVTGVPPGNYSLRLTVNPDQLFDETDYNNNTVVVPVTIPDAPPSIRSSRRYR